MKRDSLPIELIFKCGGIIGMFPLISNSKNRKSIIYSIVINTIRFIHEGHKFYTNQSFLYNLTSAAIMVNTLIYLYCSTCRIKSWNTFLQTITTENKIYENKSFKINIVKWTIKITLVFIVYLLHFLTLVNNNSHLFSTIYNIKQLTCNISVIYQQVYFYGQVFCCFIQIIPGLIICLFMHEVSIFLVHRYKLIAKILNELLYMQTWRPEVHSKAQLLKIEYIYGTHFYIVKKINENFGLIFLTLFYTIFLTIIRQMPEIDRLIIVCGNFVVSSSSENFIFNILLE